MPNASKKPKTTAKSTAVAEGPNVGDKAPAFALPAHPDGKLASTALKGAPYVIYFYPKDNTSGCTTEACDFRDSIAAFNKLGVKVIGVSKDSVASHKKFADKFQLNFPLLSDEEGVLCAAYGVWKQKSMYGRSYMGIERSTFLVDAKGVIRGVWRKVSITDHVAEVKKAVADLA